MPDTCAYCDKHLWDDVKQVHVCILSHVTKDCTDTCDNFKHANKYK